MFDAEDFWADILSEDPETIQSSFAMLPNEDERAAVIAHLRVMVSEEGWADVQRESAAAALRALGIV